MGLFANFFASGSQNEPKVTITISDETSDNANQQTAPHFSDNEAELLDSINNTDIIMPTQKLPLSDVCPYCGVVQSKPMSRKKNCSDCKESIYVRTTQDLFPYSALTEEQVAHVDFYMGMKNYLMATKDDFIKHEKQLQKKWNTPKVNTYDVLWSMYNDTALLKRNIDSSYSGTWATIQLFRNHQVATFEAAEYQASRGTDPVPYLETAQEYSLEMAKLNEYAKGLTVQSYSCCDACTKFHDKTFTLTFIEKTPILPLKTCTRPFKDGSKFVFCTCRYSEYTQY